MVKMIAATAALVWCLVGQTCQAQCKIPGNENDRCLEHVQLMELFPTACSHCNPVTPPFIECVNNVFAQPEMLTFSEMYIYRPTSVSADYSGYHKAEPKSLLCGVWGTCDQWCDSQLQGNVIVDKCILNGGYNDEIFYFEFSDPTCVYNPGY